MNPQVQQAINNINAYIVENHNNEITANVLNPILIELANLFDIVGDLSDLNTADNDSIVDAINWVLNQISTGITIHSGQADPNETPPASFAVGDLYSRLDILENPYQIYIYNGAEWAEIRQVINDGVIGLDTTWSSEKISEAIQGDRFENLPTIDLVGNEITISNASWWIQGVNYNLSPDFEDTINYTTVAGMMRKDIIVAIAGNNMIRIQGAESDTNPLEPTVPPNTLLVTSIDVFHDSIGEPTEPIVGNNYVTKSSQGWFGYQLNPSVLQATPTLGTNHSISFIPLTAGHIITGLNITSVVANKIWNGATFGIRNNSDNYPITIKNMHTGGGKILFDFPSGQDLILTKEMGVKCFKLGTVSATGFTHAYCLNDFVSGGVTSDDVSNESNVTGATVTEALNNLDTDKLDKAPNGTDNLIDVDNKINPAYLPPNIMHLQGEWNADTNTPTLSNGTGIAGYIYEVTTAGTTDFGDGDIEFKLGDWVVYGGDGKWYKSPNTGEVVGVKGDNEVAYRKGLVNIDIDDVIEPTANEFLVGNSAGTDWEKRSIRRSDLVTSASGYNLIGWWSSSENLNPVPYSPTATPVTNALSRYTPNPNGGRLKANNAIDSDDLVPLGQLEGMLTADNIDYDNTASGLLAETVQEAVDELSGHITQLHETKEDRVAVIPVTANTTISALHHGKILLVTADVTITFPAGLGAGFTGCAFRIATGGKMTPAFASGVTGNDFFADYNPGESLYVFKESDGTNVFYAV